MWYNKHGMANLLSVPMLEADGYTISTHTQGDWVVTSPRGTEITFKRDTGMTRGMSYIDVRKYQQGISMIEMIRGMPYVDARERQNGISMIKTVTN